MSLTGKKVIVVLPAYNAGATLERTFRAIPKDWVDSVILVDDVSRDNTVQMARRLGIKTLVHKKNSGYGGNQKTCYREALKDGADVVVMVHPDFQYDPSFIPEMIRPIVRGECDAVFGSRMYVRRNALLGGMPYWKFIANILLTAIENFVSGLGLTEYHSGFRAYSRSVLERIPIELNSDGFVFDTEIIFQMKIGGFKIKEIPISTRYFPEASMIGFLRSVEYGLCILLVITRYLLHIFHFRNFPQFEMLISGWDLRCSSCNGRRIQSALEGTIDLRKALESAPYLITDANSGRFENMYRCVSCGLHFVSPFPLGKDLEGYYENQPLDMVYLENEQGRRKTASRILQKVIVLKKAAADDLTILDVGCGPGLFLAEAEKEGCRVFGIELSKKNVYFARNTFRLTNVIYGSVEDIHIKFKDAYFDVITAFDVIEHLFHPREAFKVMHRKLKSGGLLIVTVPLIDSLTARLMGKRWYALIPSHLSYFNFQSLKNIYESLGFEFVHRRSYTRYLSLEYILKRLFKQRHLTIPRFLNVTIPVDLFDEDEFYLRKI